ncbi:MAG: CaiB/BaiF CoA transferase family protein [Flavobacteriaceae bacterium]
MYALEGIRVLDLSRVLAGPICGQILGDLGAEVIKVENPGKGDDTRGWGVPIGGGDTSYYYSANRNKESVAIDLASEEGQRLCAELAMQADVVIENFKLGGAARFGLDYETLSARKPALVYCSISGYGREGPFAARLGYDALIQAETGLMSVNGVEGEPPMKVGVAIADISTGYYAAHAVLAALFARERSGRGQFIDLSLFDCGLSLLSFVANSSLLTGNEPARFGNDHPFVVPYGVFNVADGPIIIAVGNDRQFQRLCEKVLGCPELASDPRFIKNADRCANRQALFPLLQPYLDRFNRADLAGKLSENGIPGGEVRSVLEAVRSAEARARHMVHEVQHPQAGPVSLLGSPLRLSDSGLRPVSRPPQLGEHSRQVLSRVLSMSDAAIDALIGKGVVQDGPQI